MYTELVIIWGGCGGVSRLVWLDRVDFSRSGCKDFSLLRLCVFFPRRANKKGGSAGAYYCFTNQPTCLTDKSLVCA